MPLVAGYVIQADCFFCVCVLHLIMESSDHSRDLFLDDTEAESFSVELDPQKTQPLLFGKINSFARSSEAPSDGTLLGSSTSSGTKTSYKSRKNKNYRKRLRERASRLHQSNRQRLRERKVRVWFCFIFSIHIVWRTIQRLGTTSSWWWFGWVIPSHVYGGFVQL